MLKTSVSLTAATVFGAIALASGAASQPAAANFAGTYRCEAGGDACMWSGASFTVTQAGNVLDVKNDKGAVGSGHVTSPITISMGPPWNMFGVVHQQGTIDWSNGSQWKKQ